MGTGEESTPAKLSKPTASAQETPTTPSYPDWSSSMQAYYGAGATPFFATPVASPTPHPYLWGNQLYIPRGQFMLILMWPRLQAWDRQMWSWKERPLMGRIGFQIKSSRELWETLAWLVERVEKVGKQLQVQEMMVPHKVLKVVVKVRQMQVMMTTTK
ncbi:hypothetical protein CsSME_00003889 [Camellia sinensis var. sinensis]